MMVGKWNYRTHEYDPYNLPEGALLYTDDMDAECVCAQCGEKMKFGEGFSSQEIHNDMGFGYCVCSDCMNEEIERWFNDKEASR